MPTAVLAPMSDDDGYESPEFDLPSENEHSDGPPAAKRSKPSKVSSNDVEPTLEDEEELALRLLRR